MEQALEIAPGVFAKCVGSPHSDNYILFINRTNESLTSAPVQNLLLHLERLEYFIVQFHISQISEAYRRAQGPCHAQLSESFVDVAEQAMILESWLDSLTGKDVTILSQSRGGVVAALLDHCRPVRRTICFGYPFMRPGSGPEAYRLEALLNTKKPFLIFQGTADEYGGTDVKDRYVFPAHITLSFFETDHGFSFLEPDSLARMKREALAHLGDPELPRYISRDWLGFDNRMASAALPSARRC